MNKKLYRSRTDRMIAGVAGGLAEYFDIDPTLIRVLFIVGIFIGGGILAYIILWIVVPEKPLVNFYQGSGDTKKEKDSPSGTGNNFSSNADQIIVENHSNRVVFTGVILILLGMIFLFDNFIPGFDLTDYRGVILIAIGIGIIIKTK
ncbi:phage shock protein C [bacterium BMS3Abin03]|nr:phage shock protein C [bacterium BMS3Abin03]HDZ58761.1 PspC domain-containing protein [Ignavibacteriales bacterium]